MSERKTLFADVILPLAIAQLYTYRIPFEWNQAVCVGQRVIVPFGKNKLYTAIIHRLHESPPQGYSAKYVDTLLDADPAVNTLQLRFWEWIASYYVCTAGEVMNAALPSALKLSSETKILLNPEKVIVEDEISDKERLILDALEVRNVLNMEEVAEILGQKTIHPLVKSLLDRQYIHVLEEVKERYKPKTEAFVRLNASFCNETVLAELMDVLAKKAFKQLEGLMAYLRIGAYYQPSSDKESPWVKKSELINSCGDAAFNALINKGIWDVETFETGRLENIGEASLPFNRLNDIQQKAHQAIHTFFNTKDVVLLHGVTSSGKTEVYIQLIEETLAEGKQVLYLLPEIALTTQIINRLRRFFGNKVGVYHSRFSDNERVEVWKNLLTVNSENGEHQDIHPKFDIIIGARSAIFLPFDRLGLIIVDEEHDGSFKQQQVSPYYHARDAAIYLASLHKAKTLIGSATPSIESYYNAQLGKYGLVEMKERFGGIQLPEIILSDVKELSRKKLMKSHFAPELIDALKLTLDKKEQAILFQNRRGFAPRMECATCSWTPQCIQCDVSLTYHKSSQQLRCHYCGYSVRPPASCAACGDTHIKLQGFGTEKIEEELAVFFPEARVLRMDLDTTRSKYSYRQIIQDFEDGNVDILVGTQMVTKGLDFDNVSLVAVLNADSMLNFPDFRSYEKSYQLMAQVGGRAGRKNKQGKVIIQTQNVTHPIIQYVVNNDYLLMYESQLAERRKFHYPPFYKLIQLTLLHKNADELNYAADVMTQDLKRIMGEQRILGPVFPVVSKIRNLFHKQILIKTEREISMSQTKQQLQELILSLRSQSSFKSLRIQIDVDPL